MDLKFIALAAAILIAISGTGANAADVDFAEWRNDSSLEAPAKLTLKSVVRRKRAALNVAGLIGEKDLVDFFIFRRAYEKPGPITVGFVSGSEVVPYDIAIQSQADKSIQTFKALRGSRMFSVNPSGDFTLTVSANSKSVLLPYALQVEQVLPSYFDSSLTRESSDTEQDEPDYERSPLREGLKDVADSVRGAKRVNMRSDLEPDSKAKYAVVEGFLENSRDADMYFISQKFKPNTHLTFWIESANAVVSISEKEHPPLVKNSIVKGNQAIDVVTGDRLYFRIAPGAGATGSVPYLFKIWMYPPDANSGKDAGHTRSTAIALDAQKFTKSEIERAAIIHGRLGLSDEVDGYRWTPAAPSHLIVSAISSPPDLLNSYSLIDAETGKTIAELNMSKESIFPQKPYIEAYISSPVFIKLTSSSHTQAVTYALDVREVSLPMLETPRQRAPEGHSFFKPAKQDD